MSTLFTEEQNNGPSRPSRRLGEGSQAFWDRMARSYPLPFDAKTLADTQRVIRVVEAGG